MFIKLVRLGRDAKVNYTSGSDPKPVINLACAYSVGWGNNEKTQWIEATLWGDRALSLEPYLKKGTQIMLVADDLQATTYVRQSDNTVHAKLKCRVKDIDLTSSGTHGQAAPQQQPAQPQPAPGDDLDDIPF